MANVGRFQIALVTISAFVPALIAAQRPTQRINRPHDQLTLVDVLRSREFPDRVQLDLSPGGDFVAFTLRNRLRADSLKLTGGARYFTPTGAPVNVAGSDVLVTDVRTRETRSISADRGTSWAPSWSHDGRRLAFYSDRDGKARVWIWERSSGELRPLSPESARPYWGFQSIRWSPDGRRVLVKLSPLGMSHEQLAALLPIASTSGAQGAPHDSSSTVTATVFVAKVAESPAARRPALAVNLDSTRSFLNAELSDLAVIDATTGAVRRIARHVRAIGYSWSPDGARVAFTTRQPDDGRGVLVYGAFDLFVVDTLAEPRLVAPRMIQEYGQRFSWSPAGNRLAFESRGALHVTAITPGATPRQVTRAGQKFAHDYRAPMWLDDDTLLELARDTLWRIPVADGDATPITAAAGQQLLEVVAPADAGRLRQKTVLLAVRDPATKRTGFASVDLGSGRRKALHQDDAALGTTDLSYHVDVSDDGRAVAYVAERADRPAEVWVADATSARASRVTDLNPAITRNALGQTRLVQWTGATGDTLKGALLLPSDYQQGTRYPLIVKVYGGSLLSNRLNRFGLESDVDNLQLLATRGYAVLLPDTRPRIGSPMADLAGDVMPGVDSVIAMGVADPERLGVLGHSYGGYSTLALLVQTTRFKAGVASGSISNLLAHYGEMRADGSAVGVGWSEQSQGRMGGSPWEFRERYIQNSPFFFLDRITAPVLLLHGGTDRTVLPARAAETFVALRRLGKEATLVRYEGEDHHPGTWSVANATDYWERIFQWFGQYLGTRSETSDLPTARQ